MIDFSTIQGRLTQIHGGSWHVHEIFLMVWMAGISQINYYGNFVHFNLVLGSGHTKRLIWSFTVTSCGQSLETCSPPGTWIMNSSVRLNEVSCSSLLVVHHALYIVIFRVLHRWLNVPTVAHEPTDSREYHWSQSILNVNCKQQYPSVVPTPIA